MLMNNYITLYHTLKGYGDNTFSKESCNKLIDKFEQNQELFENKQTLLNENNINFRMQFTQINFSKNKVFESENKILKELFLHAIYEYKQEHKIEDAQWPKEFSLEPIRMKRYLPNSDDYNAPLK
jgi:hypothetical protein